MMANDAAELGWVIVAIIALILFTVMFFSGRMKKVSIKAGPVEGTFGMNDVATNISAMKEVTDAVRAAIGTPNGKGDMMQQMARLYDLSERVHTNHLELMARHDTLAQEYSGFISAFNEHRRTDAENHLALMDSISAVRVDLDDHIQWETKVKYPSAEPREAPDVQDQ